MLSHAEESCLLEAQCDLCHVKCSTRADLFIHQQSVHQGCKPYACKYCGKRFPTVTNQRRHERIHLGKRVKCSKCPSTFTQTGDLKKHVRKLHPETFNECAFCGKYFSTCTDLDAHLQVSHEQTANTNMLESMRRKHAFHVDPESDRRESIRLAANKSPGLQKFACTVCKKWFDDYPNMCRHRKLAHQKQAFLNTQKMYIGEDSPGTSLQSPNSGVTEVKASTRAQTLQDLQRKSFYQDVSQQIHDNLTNYVRGTKNDIDNYKQHVSWPNNMLMFEKAETLSDESSLERYNFPQGFKVR